VVVLLLGGDGGVGVEGRKKREARTGICGVGAR